MSGISDLLDDIPLPRMVRIRQRFERPRIADIETEIKRGIELKRPFASLKAGASVAVTAGSRGIADLPMITEIVVREIKKVGAVPFIVPAMGSHGGATAQGQKALLEHLGISEETIGAPIRSSMNVVRISTSPRFNMPVFTDAAAMGADGIVIINRIKSHPAYTGMYESGLIKMVAVGLGKQKQAEICHNLGAERIGEFVADIGIEALKHIPLMAAIGILENSFHETARLEVLLPDEIETREPELLAESKLLAARFHIDEFDALIIDEIGKEISGAGFDTTIVGRYSSPYMTGGPRIRRVAVLDITDKSNGYGGGLGMADFTTRRAFGKFDPEQTYPNTLTSTFTNGVKIPMILKNDRQAIQACIRTCNRKEYKDAQVVRIKNTLCMEEIEVSENMLEAVRAHSKLDLVGTPQDFVFDNDGDLFQ